MVERSICHPTAFCVFLLRGQDSNLRPQAYETCKLPTAPLRCMKQGYWRKDTVIALPTELHGRIHGWI